MEDGTGDRVAYLARLYTSPVQRQIHVHCALPPLGQATDNTLIYVPEDFPQIPIGKSSNRQYTTQCQIRFYKNGKN